MVKIALYQPEIPQNTGNIVRTCAMTGSDLLLVRPLGFSTSNRMLKRAGLDYWHRVLVTFTDDLLVFLETCNTRFFFFSSHAAKPYTSIEFQETDILVFGSETAGLPSQFREKWPHLFYTIPTLSLQAQPVNMVTNSETTPPISAVPDQSMKASLPSAAEIPFPVEWQSHKRFQDSGCLNLSNAVSIVLYEALRQNAFQSLKL